jgi:hypothetical protein
MEIDQKEKQAQIASDDITYMWGVDKKDLEDQVFQGKKIVDCLSKNDLWLRSDLTRLDALFNIPTLLKIEVEELGEKLDTLQFSFDDLKNEKSTLELKLEMC